MTDRFHIIDDGMVYELVREPEGGFTTSVPALPGCVSYGHTVEESMEMIRDAIDGWLAVAREEGFPIPPQFELARAS